MPEDIDLGNGLMLRQLPEGSYTYPKSIPTEDDTLDTDPFARAALRIRQGVKGRQQLPVDEPAPYKAPNYLMEPDLQETQMGQSLPTGIAINDAGIPFNKITGEEITTVQRPNVLPIAKTPDGYTLAMPKLLDVASNVMSPLAAPSVATKAGEVVLGSGAVKTAQEAAKVAEGPFFSALENAVDTAKIGKASADQWLGYLKNQPGVKSEELATVLGDIKGNLTKAEVQDVVKQNKVQLGEVVKYQEPSKEAQKIYDAKAKLTDEAAEKLDEAIKANYGGTSFTFEGNKIYADELSHALYSGDIKPHELPRELQGVGKELADAFKVRESARNDLKNMNNYKFQSKYHDYQLPGAEPGSYKEMLLTLPEKQSQEVITADNAAADYARSLHEKYGERYGAYATGAELQKYTHLLNILNKQKDLAEKVPSFKSSHWDEVNPVAHVRMNDRIVDGKKTLHLEEIQSDWHQKGRAEGYKLSDKQKADLDNIENKLTSKLTEAEIGNPDIDNVLKVAVDKKVISPEEARNYKEYVKGENSTVPDAPFKKNWDELALKRMLHKAATEGYEGLSWTPGEAQAARYDLSKQVKSIHWQPSIANKEYSLIQIHPNDGKILKLQVDKNGKITDTFPSSQGNQFEGKNLTDVVGKEHAEKILNKKEGSLEGEGLKIGGEGMKSFYDKMLVDKANALVKKYGSKVEQKGIEGGKGFGIYDRGGNLVKEFKTASDAHHWEMLNPVVGGGRTIKQNSQPIHYLPITPELRAKAKSGFPLFSSTPILTPVTHNPFEDQNKKYKLTPVSHNPFK